jgi:hypothetical protein
MHIMHMIMCDMRRVGPLCSASATVASAVLDAVTARGRVDRPGHGVAEVEVLPVQHRLAAAWAWGSVGQRE